MSEKTALKIKVPEYGELRESVKERLLRIREAFSDTKTHADKVEALNKLMRQNSAQSPA
ncbi:hypothetical protein [Rubritalea sp.]|uniref:hypothetical protein n=1 Tax=Rubritalea sp. TaxID=2109375 RepID=UPI003EF33D14